MTQTIDDIRHLLATLLRVDADVIGPDSLLRELPNMDSAAVLEAVVLIEDHFRIEFSDSVVLRLERVQDLAEAVDDLRFGQPTSQYVH